MGNSNTSNISQREAYKLMLKDYPDVLNIEQMCEILSVSTKTGYKIIKSGGICCLKVGRAYMRTLPLVPFVKERLLAVKAEQDNNRRLCGKSYNKKYAGYVCINEIGDLIKPHYVTEQFPKLLEANGLRHIRFHDLRHSCASLMLANGVPMKQIQEWLGHSDFSTTANIYAHLDYSSKLTSADAMLSGLGIAEAK